MKMFERGEWIPRFFLTSDTCRFLVFDEYMPAVSCTHLSFFLPFVRLLWPRYSEGDVGGAMLCISYSHTFFSSCVGMVTGTAAIPDKAEFRIPEITQLFFQFLLDCVKGYVARDYLIYRSLESLFWGGACGTLKATTAGGADSGLRADSPSEGEWGLSSCGGGQRGQRGGLTIAPPSFLSSHPRRMPFLERGEE